MTPAVAPVAHDAAPAEDGAPTAGGARDLSAACDGADPHRFPDLTGSPHGEAIGCLVWWRVAGGLADGTFGASRPVTRGQMASFVTGAVLAAGGSLPPPGPGFPDTRASAHGRSVARLAAAGLASGHADGTFRPDDPVSRGQTATLLSQLLAHLGVPLAEPVDGAFTDPLGVHRDAIGRAAASGLATGHPDGTFRPGEPVTRGQMAAFLARSLAAASEHVGQPRPAAAAVDLGTLDAEVCPTTPVDVARADLQLQGTFNFSQHPIVQLSPIPRWDADPVGDPNWRFQLHTLRWLWWPISAAAETGEARYLSYAHDVVRDWVRANPRNAPVGDYAWDDHATAWRAMVLSCLALQPGAPAWLDDVVAEHRRTLADPGFYRVDGNHALNQDTGLLALACVDHAWDQRDLAAERIDVLVRRSVDAQSVTDEQAVEYQAYNLERYQAAMRVAAACGLGQPGWASRVEQMAVPLAHMTLPDGSYVTLGDTDRRLLRPYDHPATRWMASGGTDGAPPDETFVVYDAGFAFARSGWGVDQPLASESMLSLRFGPARRLHGHHDHGSLTLYADGQRLVVDPGKYAYVDTAQRAHVRSREAHNVVTTGCTALPTGDSSASGVHSDQHTDRLTVRVATCPGTSWTRTVVFVRATGEVVVVDRVEAAATADVVQRWQLELGAEVRVVRPSLVAARWLDGGRLLVEQLTPVSTTTVASGSRSPLRGWVSPSYGELLAAPNVETRPPRGERTTLVTVLRPGADETSPASSLQRSGSSGSVTLTTRAGDALTIDLGAL